ncbi:olfactory receptor 1440-like [Suncus etruscus]|uniref:olfactory receptor 1440-like n=1 Tax=Suncus etruscus TaxID=109475 RepID=UPI002110A6F4|nr:olfactory receptor 1440-like [Suncus etruscus]
MVQSRCMEGQSNHTSVIMFILLGISNERDLQLILFPIFLGTYMVTLISNLTLITLIRTDSHLHTPMYFFLSVLSLVDVFYSTSISPRMLSDFFRDLKTISPIACATQYFFAAWMGQAECCLLAAMAYDRYVAIGNPLQYSTIMAPELCQMMAVGSLGIGLICGLAETIPSFSLYYCGPNIIQHFFCNVPEIVTLSCSSPFISQMTLFVVATLVGFGSLLIILLSYGYIAASILKISSLKGSLKAFNTCASHLAVVTLFYGTALAVYGHPSSGHSDKQDTILSVFYVIIIPMLNPLIYSLRNKEIKEAFKRGIKKAAL